MKLTCEILNSLRLTKKGTLFLKVNYAETRREATFFYCESCRKCGEPFLGRHQTSPFCSIECSKSVNIGRVMKEEQKEYFRKLYIGRKMSDSTRIKMSAATSGERNPMFGKSHTEETKQRLREASQKLVGPLNGNWKGGISAEPYCIVWTVPDFKEYIKERDNYICQNRECSGFSTKLTIHHIDYVKKNCDPQNLITLCVSCNSKANSNREWHQAYYSEIIRRKYTILVRRIDETTILSNGDFTTAI